MIHLQDVIGRGVLVQCSLVEIDEVPVSKSKQGGPGQRGEECG